MSYIRRATSTNKQNLRASTMSRTAYWMTVASQSVAQSDDVLLGISPRHRWILLLYTWLFGRYIHIHLFIYIIYTFIYTYIDIYIYIYTLPDGTKAHIPRNMANQFCGTVRPGKLFVYAVKYRHVGVLSQSEMPRQTGEPIRADKMAILKCGGIAVSRNTHSVKRL